VLLSARVLVAVACRIPAVGDRLTGCDGYYWIAAGGVFLNTQGGRRGAAVGAPCRRGVVPRLRRG